MAIPFKPVGIGQNAAMHVFRINFSEDLSAIPELRAWDDFNLNTTANTILQGTTVNEDKSMIGAIGCSMAPSASWWPSAAVAGAAVDNASRLIGNDGYCLLAAAAPEADDDVFFNFDMSFPSDALPADSYAFCLSVTYRFTGAVPSVTWYGNDGGTEMTPIWTSLTSQPKGTNGAATVIRPSDAGGDGEGDVTTIPQTPDTEEFPDEIWVTDAA